MILRIFEDELKEFLGKSNCKSQWYEASWHTWTPVESSLISLGLFQEPNIYLYCRLSRITYVSRIQVIDIYVLLYYPLLWWVKDQSSTPEFFLTSHNLLLHIYTHSFFTISKQYLTDGSVLESCKQHNIQESVSMYLAERLYNYLVWKRKERCYSLSCSNIILKSHFWSKLIQSIVMVKHNLT